MAAEMIAAKLTLRDGQTFEGFSFGADNSIAGEVVFATGMVGYPESLTDPSYHGQILVLTTPMVGNYGVPSTQDKDSFGLTKSFESQDGKIHAAAVVVSENCMQPEHWQKFQTLHEWLRSQGIPGLMMVDTRSIVLRLRELGTALGKIIVRNDDIPFSDCNTRNLVAEVSTKTRQSFGHGNIVICCIDMGVKLNTLRCLLRYDVTVNVVPHDCDITQETYDGLFISNGPGNPQLCTPTIRNVRWALQQDKPVFGICMGNQMLALAAGGSTFKMKYGHRGQNQPCAEGPNGKVVITTQNHGFAVEMSTMPPEWEETFRNPNDGSNEGLRHKTKPFFAVQFHPEGRCGPQDTEYLFHDFIKMVEKSKIEEITHTKPKKVLVLGAGGITIAQAGEFDYSGSQCLKSLREEGIETVLINPNIATVQTDSDSADHIYFVPVTPQQVERVIEKERPDGILLGWGGQTALNCGVQLDRLGVFKKYNVHVLGTQISTIAVTEDRQLFRDALLQIDEHVATSRAATSIDEAVKGAHEIGFPVMVRAAFCLGGQGSGIVTNEEELKEKCNAAFAIAPQVLIEMSVKGWKEVEYEVVRDIYDNCITICNMENFDPMGVHTGESMVVAPSQTLTNDEYHMLRSASIRTIRHLGVVGECNIQYGLDPNSSRYIVIEVNARLSRSSALASKATGYPLAHVAAKLALGKGLHEIVNGVTKSTTACFEPSLDYIVMKVPRWDLSKFNMVSDKIGSMMKSVGEVMAIGRTFEEVIQKALRMVDPSFTGFDLPGRFDSKLKDWDIEETLQNPTPDRIWAICVALERGTSVDRIHELTKINKFFLTKLEKLVQMRNRTRKNFDGLAGLSKAQMLELKAHGFSDRQLASYLDCTSDAVRARRLQLGVTPLVKQIDTVAGEFPAAACYLYTSYNAQHDDVTFGESMYVVLGCGVYRIGNSVEFDYCGVLCARELRRLGHKVIMINYNPETVSTDYDECDRLYFDEVSDETVLDILGKERVAGVVISVGGQIVQNMALKLKEAGLPILGTDPRYIDMAEDRNKFSKMCDDIGVSQPEWVSASSVSQVHQFANKVGYPCLVRPSYVLSGSAMSVISCDDDVDRYLSEASRVSGEYPAVVSKYHENATEYDVDVVAHYGKVLCYSISEHVENAGVHSGDATMFLPPQNKDRDTMLALYNAACLIAERLHVCGPMNVQFLRTADACLHVIEANVRCSRSVPFVSKTLGISFPAVMVSAFLSKKDTEMVPIKRAKMTHIGCKAAMFSFNRLAGADPITGVEMASTGEVGVFGRDKHEVILKAMLCQNFRYPEKNVLVSIEEPADADAFVPYVEMLAKKLDVFATDVASAALTKAGVAHTKVTMPGSSEEPCAETLISEKQLHLVIQLRNKSRDFLLKRMKQSDAPPSYWVRRLAVDFNTPLITDANIARLFAEAFVRYTPADIEIESFQNYVPKIFRKLENNNCTLLHRHKVGLCADYDIDSVCLAMRLKSENLDFTCYHADLGQSRNPQDLRDALQKNGISLELVDLRNEMASACFDMVTSMSALDHILWQVGVMGRDVLRRGMIQRMRDSKMTVIAQASSRSAREMAFERYAKTLAPEVAVYSPWRDPRNLEDLSTTDARLQFVRDHGLAIDGPQINTTNFNLAGVLYKESENPSGNLRFTKSIDQCPDDPEFVTLTFREGRCVEINNIEVTPLQAMRLANELGRRHGLGVTTVTENGIKKTCEAPGLTLLARGLKIIYDETLDEASRAIFRTYATHIKEQCMQHHYGEMSTKSAMVAIKFLAAAANGSVTLELHKGEAIFLHTSASKAAAKASVAISAHDDVFTPGTGSFTDFEW